MNAYGITGSLSKKKPIADLDDGGLLELQQLLPLLDYHRLLSGPYGNLDTPRYSAKRGGSGVALGFTLSSQLSKIFGNCSEASQHVENQN